MLNRLHHRPLLRGLTKALALGLALALVCLTAAPAASECGQVCCAPAPVHSVVHRAMPMDGRMPGMTPGRAVPDQSATALITAPGCFCGSAAEDCAAELQAASGGRPDMDRTVSLVRVGLSAGQAPAFAAHPGLSQEGGLVRLSKAPPRAGPIYLATLALLI